ncbi:MAG: hypothetical protein J6B64_01885 [Bacilli bacterium]|nr:hypothetical protein [Bacilli bacterium]MBP3921306.1 hypothetical protein [Bacilli bacterium]
MQNKIFGIVINYDGYTGEIITETGKYLLLKNNIKDKQILNNNDKVMFNPETIELLDIKTPLATFIEKI